MKNSSTESCIALISGKVLYCLRLLCFVFWLKKFESAWKFLEARAKAEGSATDKKSSFLLSLSLGEGEKRNKKKSEETLDMGLEEIDRK